MEKEGNQKKFFLATFVTKTFFEERFEKLLEFWEEISSKLWKL